VLLKKIFLITLCSLFFFLEYAAAQQHNLSDSTNNKTSIKIFKDENGIAIKGYDPVAYFTENAALNGKPEFSYKYNNAVWQFINEKHLKMFEKNPGKYIPQYGGYCAYGISHKAWLVKTDPTAWKIVDGKLYFNLDKSYNKAWMKDPWKNIAVGNTVWNKLNNNAQKK
jgi:YHS domain-containing protein